MVSEIIVRKIEEEGENKLAAAKKIEEKRSKISLIDVEMEKHQSLLHEIAVVYEKFKDKLSLKTFLHAFGLLLNRNQPETLTELLEKSLTNLTGKEMVLNTEDIQKCKELTSGLIQSRTILRVFDLSIGYKWLASLLEK